MLLIIIYFLSLQESNNYKFTGLTCTTVAEEKKMNPRLSQTKDKFVEIMENLGLPYPKKIGKRNEIFVCW